MTDAPAATATLLPNALPLDVNARTALFVFRRMGAHGLADAHAARAMFTAFGRQFRRPLLLMRALMADLAGSAQCSIAIAPCCCPRTTASETAFLAVLARAETAPDLSRLLLADLLGQRRIEGVLASATAVATAFADAGRPISA